MVSGSIGNSRARLLLAAASTALIIAPVPRAHSVPAVTQPATASAPGQALDPKVQQFLRDADSALKTGNVNLAVIQLKNAVQLAPGQGEPRAKLGLALLQQGAAVAAERELRQARQEKAPDALAVPGILRAMLQRGETKALLAEFPEPAPDAQGALAAEMLRSRGIALAILGQTAAASAEVDRSLRLKRDVPTLLARAKMAGLQNDPVLSRQLIDEALKLEPKSEEAFAMSVSLLRQRGESKKALAAVDDFLNRNSASIAARTARIELLLDLKDEAGAKKDVDAISKQAPRSAVNFYYRAVLAARDKNFKGAWAQAQRLPPNFVLYQPNIAMEVAQIAIASGNQETGAAILAGLLSRNPEVQQARLQLSSVQLREKHPEAALETLGPIKSSDAPQVQAALAQAYLQLRRYADATSALRKATASSAFAANAILGSQLAFSEMASGNAEEAVQTLQQLETRNPGNSEVAAQLSTALVREGKFDDALVTVDRFAKAQPKSPLPYFYRGLVLGAQAQLTAASAALGQSLANDPKFLPARFYRADVLLARGMPEEATKDLQQVLAQDPTDVVAYIGLAQIAFNAGRESDVVNLLNKAISFAPKDPRPRIALANYHVSHARYPEAKTIVDELLQQSPGNPDALAAQGQIQLAMGDKKGAVAVLRAWATANPQLPAAQALLANALYESKDTSGAESAIKKAIELAPRATQFRSILISYEIAAGKTDSALATAREYNSEYPGPIADLLVANTLVGLKRTTDAKALLEKAYTAKPDAALALGLAHDADAVGDSKRAIAVLSGWVAKNPRDFAVRQQYAALLFETGDKSGAQREYEELVKERPDDPIALDGLSWNLQRDDSSRALALASLAAKIAPRSAEVIDTLGWIKFEHRDTDGGLTLLKRAHDLKSDDPEIGYHFALALNATGRRAEAKALLKSILAKSPKFADVQSAQQLVARW